MQRIGEYLLTIGAMTKQQVNEVLETQKKEPNKLFGEIALELGFISDEAIDSYFKSQEEP